jgi:hypothetical protein
MAYGHAERNLALVRGLEAQTRQLLESLDRLDPEQSAWLQEVTRPQRPIEMTQTSSAIIATVKPSI